MFRKDSLWLVFVLFQPLARRICMPSSTVFTHFCAKIRSFPKRTQTTKKENPTKWEYRLNICPKKEIREKTGKNEKQKNPRKAKGMRVRALNPLHSQWKSGDFCTQPHFNTNTHVRLTLCTAWKTSYEWLHPPGPFSLSFKRFRTGSIGIRLEPYLSTPFLSVQCH